MTVRRVVLYTTTLTALALGATTAAIVLRGLIDADIIQDTKDRTQPRCLP